MFPRPTLRSIFYSVFHISQPYSPVWIFSVFHGSPSYSSVWILPCFPCFPTLLSGLTDLTRGSTSQAFSLRTPSGLDSQTRDVAPTLKECWHTVFDARPTFHERWVNAFRLSENIHYTCSTGTVNCTIKISTIVMSALIFTQYTLNINLKYFPPYQIINTISYISCVNLHLIQLRLSDGRSFKTEDSLRENTL